MFVLRFNLADGQTHYAGIIGKGTTAGSWGFTSYEDAQIFETAEAADEVLATHYTGPAGKRAAIVDSFDETPPPDGPGQIAE